MGSGGKDAVKEAQRLAGGQLTDYQAQQRTAKAAVEQQKQAYKDIQITNPYADMQNPYAENVFEDLTVNQQQAQFEAQQGQQQRANIMSNMTGAAGSSGVAGLAQAMANQGQLQTQRASASIGQQESANQRAAAQQAGQIQQMERQGAWKADMTRLGGAEQARGLEKDKVSTLFQMGAGRLTIAKTAQERAREQMWGGIGGMFTPNFNQPSSTGTS